MAMLLVSVIAIVVARPTPQMFWIGLPLVLIGQLIRMWSAGYLVKLSELITAGPFALCRNPLYIGSFMMSVGYFLMCNQLYICIGGIIIFWLFHVGAVTYEEKLLLQKFGHEYKEYCEEVPRFIPRLRHFAGQGKFSVDRARYNDECGRLLGTTVLSALFGLMAYIPYIAPLNFISEHM